MPGYLKLHIDVGIPASKMSEALRASFMSLIESGSREPLAQALFHEAWNQRIDFPRSSLLIGVAAAEVGFKRASVRCHGLRCKDRDEANVAHS